MFQWWQDRKYVRAKRAGVVDSVTSGRVVVDGLAYDNLTKTHVQPGQVVIKRQVIGKR